MTLKRTLTALVNAIVEEAGRNPEFRERIEMALDVVKPAAKMVVTPKQKPVAEEKRKGGRRAPAVLDPIDLAKHGEAELRSRLADLDLEKLLDVVAQYGMDPGKLVMKWKDRERIIDRIVELALGRATKGDAFRAE
ncbi:hypothetical protein H4S14_003995 [Agrobacterium vitis]|nr:hypothetical protein [Agrobacterium vitis]MBE1440223.1 hypothetical protein [Agrobacterium vitis]